jgi:hypothetical protein
MTPRMAIKALAIGAVVLLIAFLAVIPIGFVIGLLLGGGSGMR